MRGTFILFLFFCHNNGEFSATNFCRRSRVNFFADAHESSFYRRSRFEFFAGAQELTFCRRSRFNFLPTLKKRLFADAQDSTFCRRSRIDFLANLLVIVCYQESAS